LAKIRGPLYSIDCSGMFGNEVIFLSSREGIYTQDVYPGNVPDTVNQWKNQAAVSLTNELYSIPDRTDWEAWEIRVGEASINGNNLFTSLANKAHHRGVSFNVFSAVSLNRPESPVLTFKSRYDSLVLISCWPCDSPPLPVEKIALDPSWQALHSQPPVTDLLSSNSTPVIPLPETDSINLSSPETLLLLIQARGWDNPETRKLDWNNWDWESWNQAKESGHPLKLVTDCSAQAPLNRVELSGLQPGLKYYCRLTELPRLLPGPPGLTASYNPQNSISIHNAEVEDSISFNNTEAQVSPLSDNADTNVLLSSNNAKAEVSLSSNNKVTDSFGAASEKTKTIGNIEDTAQSYLSRAKSALESSPHTLVYAVTCCLPDHQDASISWIVCENSPAYFSPEISLTLSWQAMPEVSYYNIYRTFSSAGLPCGYLGNSSSASYQDQGQVIQKFIQSPSINPYPLIYGDSGFYIF